MHMIDETLPYTIFEPSDDFYQTTFSSVIMNGNSMLSGSSVSYDSAMSDDYIIQDLETKLEKWDPQNLMKWIMDTCEQNGRNYEEINLHYFRKYPSADLLRLTEQDFLLACKNKSYNLASWLYRKFQDLIEVQSTDKFETSIAVSPHSFENTNLTTDYVSQSSDSDGEAEPVVQKRKRGRPKSSTKTRRKSEHKTGIVWEFLRDLLLNPDYCPEIICWENYEEGVFKFVSSKKIAQLWGLKRGNIDMNYEKFSRAMRYHYKTQALGSVGGQRLVYRFGRNAKGWHTENPNFINSS